MLLEEDLSLEEQWALKKPHLQGTKRKSQLQLLSWKQGLVERPEGGLSWCLDSFGFFFDFFFCFVVHCVSNGDR